MTKSALYFFFVFLLSFPPSHFPIVLHSMRVLLLMLVMAGCVALAKPSNDEQFVCPSGCVDEREHNLLQRELHDARGEAERVRGILRHGGAQDKSDKATGRRRYSAQDLMIGLLQEAGKAAQAGTCGSCITRICKDRDFSTYFDASTEVIVRDGSRAHSCTGCECAVSEVAGLLRALSHVTKMSRVVSKSHPSWAVIEDHILHSGSKGATSLQPIHTTFERELDASEDECIPQSDPPLKVKESNLGEVSTVVYVADLNEHDNTVGRISIYILHH